MKLKFANALSLALIVAMLFTSAALADNVVNNVTVGGNDTFTAPGSTTIGYKINTAAAGDSQSGCNASDGSPATVTLSVPVGVTASTTSLMFTACNVFQNVTFSSSTPGTYAINVVNIVDSGTGSYNDQADFTLHVLGPTDSTAPVITPNVSGTLGSNGWYTSDVTVSWSVVDNESAIASSTGCDPTTINADTAGITLTCTATSTGGTSSQSVTIKRDATAPTISGSASPAANGAGWNNTNVAVTFLCGDNLSGVVSCGPDATLSGEGAGQSVSGTAVDAAGNTASSTVSNIDIDKTTPTITGSTDRPANGNYWYNADVTVTFTCGDGGSGVASCSAPSTLGEGAGQSVTGTATDYADNSNSATVSGINIDETVPTASASASPAANTNGWNNTDVTVSFSGNDGLSGIDFCDAAVVLSSEGAGQSASGDCTDKAGNVSAPASATVSIDKTAPSVSLVGGPANGGIYYFGSVPTAPTCSASDALSGLAGACSVSGYSAAIGFHTVSAAATDKAGNTGTATQSYTVLAWTTGGFYQPVDMGGVWNTVRNGSTVPLKFELWAGSTELTDIASVKSITSAVVQCTAGSEDAIETVVTATGGTTLRYDATAGQFIFNWKTPATANKCYRVTMEAQDGSKIIALFKLK
jgi:hypothetical protein